MRRLILVLVFLAAPALVHAQAITAYPYKVYNQGASAPIQTTTFQVANVTCNQPVVAAPGTVQNPSKVIFDDPSNAGKTCVWTDPGNGILFSLPFGTQIYESTIAATNSVGTGLESARSNLFTRPGQVPGVLTGLKVAP